VFRKRLRRRRRLQIQNLERLTIAMINLDSERAPSRRLWILAAVGALVLHVGGGALAVAHLQTDDLDESLGAPAIEIGLELMSPRLEASDLPPGPDTDASVASSALAEQRAELKETELPKDVPTEADDPDRMVTPNDSNKPREEDSKIAAVQTTASTESVAAEATATPSSEAIRKGPRSIAPAQGIGESARRARLTWQKELMAHLEKHKRYPAERTQKSAEILVGFALDRMGHILSTSIVKGSGDRAFDEAALAMVRHSDPVPQPPPLVADEGLNFTLPVIFKVKGKS
jgi:periplasmic protein TonB